MNGERQWVMSEVIAWLESPDGEKWSRRIHRNDRHDNLMPALLVTIKDDDSDMVDAMYGRPVWVA